MKVFEEGMKCPIETQENAEVLLAYSAGRLDRERAGGLERHLAACPACRTFQESQQRVWEALDAWEPQPISANFDRRLYARIEAEGRPWWARMWGAGQPALLRQGLPIAAAACLLVMAGLISQRPHGPAAPARPAARVETVQAEQLERTLDDMELLRQFTLATSGEQYSSNSM